MVELQEGVFETATFHNPVNSYVISKVVLCWISNFTQSTFQKAVLQFTNTKVPNKSS